MHTSFLFSLFFFLSVGAFTVASRSSMMPHHSFGPPFTVNNWIFEGTAYFREHYIRLTPDRQSRAGGLWNAVPSYLEEWEAVLEFKIHGSSKLGADGLAMWYLKEKKLGSLFGVDPFFVGLGIVVDTYDNDGSGVHPRLTVLVSDGNQEFSHNHDHEKQDHDTMERGGCPFPARQTGTTSFFKVTYKNNVVTVEVDHDRSGEWKPCTTVGDVELPTGYFFGFTAATGQLADNHDLYSFYLENLQEELPQIYHGEQYTLQGFQNKVEGKLQSLQKSLSGLSSLPSAHPSEPSSGSLDTTQIDAQINSLKSQIQTIQTDFRRELDSLKSKLENVASSSSSLSSAFSLPPPIPSSRSTPTPSASSSTSPSSSSSSFASFAIIILLIVILLVLIRFQYQTRKELKKKLF